jgi:hypothetical protein
MRRSFLIFFVSIAFPQVAEAQGDEWQKVYEGTAKETRFASVWAANAETWVAGGKKLLVVGKGASIHEHQLGGLIVMGIRQTPRGLFAFGSHGAIWKIQDNDVHLEYQARKTEIRKPRDPDMLFTLGEVEVDGKNGLLASGGIAVFSETPGAWQRITDEEKARKLTIDELYGKWFPRPANCDSPTWVPISSARRYGILVCRNRSAFLVRDTVLTALPRMPKDCRGYISGAEGGTQSTTVLCDERRSLWQLRGSSWTEIKTGFMPDGMAASDNCIFAVSQRSVWRRCTAPPTPAAKPAAIEIAAPKKKVGTSPQKIEDKKRLGLGCAYRGR